MSVWGGGSQWDHRHCHGTLETGGPFNCVPGQFGLPEHPAALSLSSTPQSSCWLSGLQVLALLPPLATFNSGASKTA